MLNMLKYMLRTCKWLTTGGSHLQLKLACLACMCMCVCMGELVDGWKDRLGVPNH